jgi:hypothetical protein
VVLSRASTARFSRGLSPCSASSRASATSRTMRASHSSTSRWVKRRADVRRRRGPVLLGSLVQVAGNAPTADRPAPRGSLLLAPLAGPSRGAHDCICPAPALVRNHFPPHRLRHRRSSQWPNPLLHPLGSPRDVVGGLGLRQSLRLRWGPFSCSPLFLSIRSPCPLSTGSS